MTYIHRPGDGMATKDEHGHLFVSYVNDPLQLSDLSERELRRALAGLEASHERTRHSPGLGMYNRRALINRGTRQISYYRAALAARQATSTHTSLPSVERASVEQHASSETQTPTKSRR